MSAIVTQLDNTFEVIIHRYGTVIRTIYFHTEKEVSDYLSTICLIRTEYESLTQILI